ncbi:MAG: ATP-binding protein [Chitinophagaceae bacterium]|nr:ATP-binding protein [Chitinophagaceae bacterium]MCW5926541.1 ATP-binding protein [Chitinophagaceae bacterium]
MNVADNWQEKNDQYLAVSIEWLRLKLMKAEWEHSEEKPSSKEISNRDFAIRSAALQIKDLESGEPLPLLAFVKKRFGLSAFEQQLLLLCVAMELDTRIPALFARAQNDPGKPYPTFALAMILFDAPAWDVLSPQRPLRYWRLIEITRLMNQPLVSAALKADERMVNFIKGLNYLDERIVRLSTPFDISIGSDTVLPPSQQKAADIVTNSITTIDRDQFPFIVQLTGQDTLSKQLIAQKAAETANFYLVSLMPDLLPQQTTELEELARLWQRESLLLRVMGFIDAQKSDILKPGTQNGSFQLHRFFSVSQGIFLIGVREYVPGLATFSTGVEIKKPSPAEQQAEWKQMLGENVNGTAALLAGQFSLNTVTIRQIVRGAIGEDSNREEDLHQKLWSKCLATTSPELDTLVQKLELKATWEDIVLPEASEKQLRQIASQVRYRSLVYDNWGYRDKMNRGLGINALFVGESGTGKTMAAEVLANDLGLHLYRIDLSGVVSKYIGETEKNLRRLFDAAEDGGAILFFDEADALFGKRSEVKDSHDRYANIEINYLLQRMESYNGLAILATNKKSALDDAFIRRLRFIVHFPFPGTKERKMIAEKMFPASVPKSKIDYDRLAALNLTGGNFYNIAINAAFMAAEDGGEVTMPLILSAARAEFQKMERPVKEADFVWNG